MARPIKKSRLAVMIESLPSLDAFDATRAVMECMADEADIGTSELHNLSSEVFAERKRFACFSDEDAAILAGAMRGKR